MSARITIGKHLIRLLIHQMDKRCKNEQIMRLAIIGALLSAVNMPAYVADVSKTYGSVQYALGSYSETGVEDFKPTTLVGRLGTYFNEYFSAEGGFGFGQEDDNVNILGSDVSLEAELAKAATLTDKMVGGQ